MRSQCELSNYTKEGRPVTFVGTVLSSWRPSGPHQLSSTGVFFNLGTLEVHHYVGVGLRKNLTTTTTKKRCTQKTVYVKMLAAAIL